MHADHVGFVHLHLHLDHRQVGHRHQQADVGGERARHRHFALFLGEPGDAAGHRRHDVRLGELVARRRHRGARLLRLVLRRIEVRFRDVERGLRLLQLLLGHELRVLRVQLLGAGEGALRLIAVRLRLHGVRLRRGEAGLRLLQVRFVNRRVDLQQEVALVDEIPLLHRDPRDTAGDVRADVDLLLGLDLAARRDCGHQVAAADLLESHVDAAVAIRAGAHDHEHDQQRADARPHQHFVALGHVR